VKAGQNPLKDLKSCAGLPKGPFTNYVCKRRGVGVQKNRLFVNIYTIENLNVVCDKKL